METCIQDLPETVLLQIFQILASQRLYNLFRLRLVCRAWYEIATDSTLWKKVCFPGSEKLNSETLERVISWSTNIKEVDASSCPLVDDRCLEIIASGCPRLGVLNVNNCRISDFGLRAISKSCHNLNTLIISYHDEVSITSEIISEIISNCPNFEHLKIFYEDEEDEGYENSFLVSKELLEALVFNKNVKSFCCVNATLLDETVFASCYNGSLNVNLTALYLQRCIDLTSNVLIALTSRCSRLVSLDVSYCPGINDTGITAVSEFCRNLEYLNLRSCQCLTDIAIESVAKNCKHLKYLCVAGCELPRPTGNITDVAIQSIAEKCSSLRQLDVRWCQCVTDIGIVAIATSCPSLTHLNVCGCLAISNVSLLVIATYCKDLECLEVAECLRITHASINTIAHNCIKLKHLDMQVCSYLMDLDFRRTDSIELALNHIDLSYCTKITDDCIKYIAKYCKKLSYISLAGCHRITDAGMKYIANNCSELHYLDMSFRGSQSSARISDDSISLLATKCQQLTYLDLIGCWSVTQDCVKIIVEKCLYLKQLNISLLFDITSDIDGMLSVENMMLLTRSTCNIKRVAKGLRNGKSAQSFILQLSGLML